MPSLSEPERCALLHLARAAVNEAVLHRKLPDTIPVDGVFSSRRGVFVTLQVHGKLRGCIGVVEPEEPLGEAVVRCAAGAALTDPRFSPVRKEELVDLGVELSLLSQPEVIEPDAIELGRHGLLVSQRKQRGLLLPQVAEEHHLTRDQFLEETCLKAGLPRLAWKNPETRIEAFTCEVFKQDASGEVALGRDSS